jgi:hypothetical protein
MEAIEEGEAAPAPSPAEEEPAAVEATVEEGAPASIRFAEEALSTAEPKKRKKAKKTERKVEEPEAKAKKTKRARRPVIEEEEFEELDV